jgi:hypothetical protein
MKSKNIASRRKYNRNSRRIKKFRGGNASLQTAQFPNVYNTIGYNTNLGNHNSDPSDSSNQISSRLLMGGSRKSLRSRGKNNRRNSRRMNGGNVLSTDLFLGAENKMNSTTAFGTTAGAFWNQKAVFGTSTDNSSFISKQPLV